MNRFERGGRRPRSGFNDNVNEAEELNAQTEEAFTELLLRSFVLEELEARNVPITQVHQGTRRLLGQHSMNLKFTVTDTAAGQLQSEF